MSDKEAKLAVALKYDDQESAPKVIASGQGHIAEKLISAAESARVPVREQPDLAKNLIKLDIGQLIPPELYIAVAEVLAYVYQLDDNNVNKTQK